MAVVISKLGWINDWVMCSRLTKVVSSLHIISCQWALPSYIEMTLDMVSAGATYPWEPSSDFTLSEEPGGMFIMARVGAASDSGGLFSDKLL